MARQPKFMAWDKETCTLVPVLTLGATHCDLAIDAAVATRRRNNDEIELFEGIGFQDRHQAEIFEGHIVDVKRRGGDAIYRVVVEDIRRIPDDLYGSSLQWREIVGHIRLNPELY